MSFWVYLTDPQTEESLPVECHQEGGTYALGGTGEAEINVTYNYSPWFYRHLDEESGLRWLNGRPAHRTVDRFRHAIQMLGTERSMDYWKPTSGNAGYTLNILLQWAEQHPKGIWIVS